MNWHRLWAGLFCERTKKCTCVLEPEIRGCSNLLLVYTPILSFVAHKTSLDWRSLRSKTCNGDPTSVLRTYYLLLIICLMYDYLDDGKQRRTSPSLRQPSVDRKFLNRAIKAPQIARGFSRQFLIGLSNQKMIHTKFSKHSHCLSEFPFLNLTFIEDKPQWSIRWDDC